MKKRTLSGAARTVLNMRLPEDHPLRPELEELGLEPRGAQAVCYALFRKAAAGDVSAAKLLRELVGEKYEGGDEGRLLPSDAFSAMSDDALRALIGGAGRDEARNTE